MANIKKIKEGTATIYPATIPQAVVDPTSGKTVRTELDEKATSAELSQLAGEVSLLDAIQGAKIKDIESIISTMNPNQSAQLSVSGGSPLSLPKNAANGGMSVKLEGLTAENLVTGGKLIIATSYSHPTGNRIDVINGNKYYGKRLYQTISGTDGAATGRIVTLNPTHEFVRAADSSRVSTYSGATEIQKILYTYGPQVGTVLTGEFSDVMIINLTATFGAGNEPTVEECDAMFADYFEGVKSFEPTGRVRSVGRNLFDSGYWKNISNYPTPFIGGYRNGSLRLKPNTTYTFRVTLKGSEKPMNYFQVSGGDGARQAISAPTTTYPSVRSFTTGSDGILTLSVSGGQSGLTNHFETTNFMLVEGGIASPYEPYKETNLYLTAPELRSNGTVKDEIRKGTNGYEMVKRVGVGTLGGEIINQANILEGFVALRGDILGNTITTTGGGGGRKYILNPSKWYKITLNYTADESWSILQYTTGSLIGLSTVLTAGTNVNLVAFIQSPDGGIYFRNPSSGRVITINSMSIKEVSTQDVIAIDSTFSEIGSNVHYTLATPVTTPISYGGILNSAENGTVYHEPVIADAGVYDTKMDILLTDYPIATIQEIIKHENGIDTYLNATTAVIASDGLSFTHPDLADGDLVLFTYAYDKESTNGNITATFYDSNVVKIDTVTGKAYKITDVVTNGVLTRTLTEV